VRVLVCTVVHHPADARIYYRQIRALLEAGHQVTYIAPMGEEGAPAPLPSPASAAPSSTPASRAPVAQAPAPQAPVAQAPAPQAPASQAPAPQAGTPDLGSSTIREAAQASLTFVTIPRAVGKRRLGALRAARAALAEHAPAADLLLVHDPELLLVLPPRAKRPPTVWDVHEDTAAALTTKAWLPRFLRPVAAGGVLLAERQAERRLHLILAEKGYRDRFTDTHPVVPNTTYVPEAAAPPAGPRRVIYVGHISPDRGSAEMSELARLLAAHGISVELVGSADAQAQEHIRAAQADLDGDAGHSGEAPAGGGLHWHGFVPNEQALALADGALAGLSLLQDEANFRVSMPTKVVEYMARGLPVITTPLPLAVELVEGADCGFVVPFNDPQAAAEAILRLDADPSLRVKMGERGHEAAQRDLGWPAEAKKFVAQLEQWARNP
jgi:glycosyltransferase involved in cell wall biosynthesis